ncbi:uncharacterized protein B0H18DRAFT_878426 [Fomitopsis serialis]|uniref:uncharacterized protein n=1 Tax=Fomitopsis serialis TaxID=139415 RepID=UPI002007EE04|nr:uncharacterized protein B0H18DRAFT_878426 [Neoantrodia serialis]KAH9923686.1 hypothetical protein B0H18DRAFT_878426 [Neoantrodia serialis]
MSKSTLSSVVSNLVRAQMGSAMSPTVTDEDLDRHVAELILKEAKQKAEKYGKDGIRAYLQSNFNESNAPRANKRFLSSIIKNTDDHNKTILRAQAQAAQEIRLEREEQERRERRARAEEAVAAERMRRLMGQSGRTEWASNWDRGGSRDRKRRERSWEGSDSYDGDEPERERKRERRSDRHEGERRHRHRSRSGEGRKEKLRLELKRKGKAKATDDADIAQTRRSPTSRKTSATRDGDRRTKSRTRTPDADDTRNGSTSSRTMRSSMSPARSSPSPPSPLNSPPPLPPLPSKMDKYFESSYDPRLDVAPLALPTVPKTGLIDDADFAGWDAMLEVIRQRREYKAEKKILERWGVGKDKEKKKGADTVASWSEGGSSVMDIKYKKKGSVREWDMGKEGF